MTLGGLVSPDHPFRVLHGRGTEQPPLPGAVVQALHRLSQVLHTNWRTWGRRGLWPAPTALQLTQGPGGNGNRGVKPLSNITSHSSANYALAQVLSIFWQHPLLLVVLPVHHRDPLLVHLCDHPWNPAFRLGTEQLHLLVHHKSLRLNLHRCRMHSLLPRSTGMLVQPLYMALLVHCTPSWDDDTAGPTSGRADIPPRPGADGHSEKTN
mmetsp:Transcript_91424/g.209509  ORF Transcript_91424/g.209509 Transcript_91424/m.209509 type:complete len:209 (-) Transcript_91424:2-628(-)